LPEDNIKTDFKEIAYVGVDWVHLGSGQELVSGCCEHGDEPSGFTEGVEFENGPRTGFLVRFFAVSFSLFLQANAVIVF
jgi:hypothetical protein